MERRPQDWREALERHANVDRYTHRPMLEQAVKEYADEIETQRKWRSDVDARIGRLEVFQQRLIGMVLLLGFAAGGGGIAGLIALFRH